MMRRRNEGRDFRFYWTLPSRLLRTIHGYDDRTVVAAMTRAHRLTGLPGNPVNACLSNFRI